MNWSTFHKESERHASNAEAALRSGHAEFARSLYQKAAEAESRSLDFLDPSTQARTLGICVVSTAALWYKGNQLSVADRFICEWLAKDCLPDFAREELQSLLLEIWVHRPNGGHLRESIRRILESLSRKSSPKGVERRKALGPP